MTHSRQIESKQKAKIQQKEIQLNIMNERLKYFQRTNSRNETSQSRNRDFNRVRTMYQLQKGTTRTNSNSSKKSHNYNNSSLNHSPPSTYQFKYGQTQRIISSIKASSKDRSVKSISKRVMFPTSEQKNSEEMLKPNFKERMRSHKDRLKKQLQQEAKDRSRISKFEDFPEENILQGG